MNKKTITYIKLLIFIIVLVVFDQLSKYWATVTLKGNNDIYIIKDVLHLHYLDGGNTGAAWGMLSGQIWLFIVFTIIAVTVLVKLLVNICDTYSLKKSTIVLKYLLSALIAGALGNLIDRIIHNYVIDFIYFKLINFPVFNVADCYVSVSCVLIVIICIFFMTEKEFNEIFSLKIKRNIKDDK